MIMPKVSDQYVQARRRQIMDAALACFSREGFHRTTMQDIIRQSRLSAGAIYRYFDSKELIVAAIAEERRSAEQAVLERGRDSGAVSDVLAQLISISLGRLTDPAERRWRRVTVQLWSEALRDAQIMSLVRSGLDGPVEQLAAVIRRAQHEDTISKTIDPTSLARVCAAIFQGLVLQQAWDPAVDVEAYVAAAHAIVEAIAPSRRSAMKARTGSDSKGRRKRPYTIVKRKT
jgi:TetR/AcrR family transcriptional regulator, transcriptional repressor of aconitase